MLQIIKAKQRGHADYGWLDTNHTFSFNTYYNPEMMNFRALRVINEDRVTAGQGFGTHSHRDMEILSYVVAGAIAHKDSTGGEEILRPHEWQRMTAGNGIKHSEFNPSQTENLHFYQIWILPAEQNLTPGYEQKMFAPDDKIDKLKLVASPDARDGSLKINQDAFVYNSILRRDKILRHELSDKRYAWLQIVKGEFEINGAKLHTSDGAAISNEKSLEIKSLSDDGEFILFDLA